MANLGEVTPEMEEGWTAWVEARPEIVQKVIQSKGFAPWKLYRMKSTGHRVVIRAFDERLDDSITLKVAVSGLYNIVQFERTVFGVDPNDLEECELPDPDEPRGALLTYEEVSQAIDGHSTREERMEAIKKAADASLDTLLKSNRKA